MNTESDTDSSIPQQKISSLDICNLALAKLGESPLSAIDANGPLAARLCHMHYHPVRRELLCSSRWSFATQLCRLHSEEEEDGIHAIAHSLPLDCLRVLQVSSPGWTLRGRCIYCPAADIRLLYTRDLEEPALFEPLFIEALACRLACKLCIPLTASISARKVLQEEYQRLSLPEAAHFNAVQDRSNDSHPLYRLWKSCSLSVSHCE